MNLGLSGFCLDFFYMIQPWMSFWPFLAVLKIRDFVCAGQVSLFMYWKQQQGYIKQEIDQKQLCKVIA